MGMSGVLYEAIAICVAVAVNPFQGKPDVRPQIFYKFAIPGALKISVGENHE